MRDISLMKDVVWRPGILFFGWMASLLNGRLARASVWLFAGNIATGALGYVFHILMGRMLTPGEYGLFSATMALFSVLSAPLSTLMMVVSRKVSELRAKGDGGSIARFYRTINLRSLALGVVAFALCAPFAGGIKGYLHAPTVAPTVLLGAMLLLTIPPIINNAFLQGLQSFAWLSAGGFLWVLLKILFSSGLVAAGHGVSGALGGVVLSAVAGWAVTFGALCRPLAVERGKPFREALLPWRASLPVLVANGTFAAMTQLDIVLVNHYFPAAEAGLYASAAVLGKAVMYLPSGIALALFPMVAENHAREEGSAHLLLQAIGLALLLCGAGALFYFLFGERLLVLLYGEGYRSAAAVLRIYGFAILPMGFVLLAENFLIAKGRVLFAYLFAMVAPFQLMAIHFFHDSLQAVVIVMGVCGSFLALLGYGFLWRSFKGGARA